MNQSFTRLNKPFSKESRAFCFSRAHLGNERFP
jgi:hypothetical protein